MALHLSLNYFHRLEGAKSIATKPAMERGVVHSVQDIPTDGAVETAEEEEEPEEEEEDSESVRILLKSTLVLLIHSAQDVEIIMDSETPNRSRDFRYAHENCLHNQLPRTVPR